jgi:hypothetical protein
LITAYKDFDGFSKKTQRLLIREEPLLGFKLWRSLRIGSGECMVCERITGT